MNINFRLILLCAFMLTLLYFIGFQNGKQYIAKPSKPTIILFLSDNEGNTSKVQCDSFQMQGTKKAFIFVSGTKINIEAENIMPLVVNE